MPRTRRWEQIVHGFSAGILSPAAQDQIDSQAWLAGAAKLENFSVERDGGISGRPAFVRSGVVLPKPVYGLLAGQAWDVDLGGSPNENTTTTSVSSFPADLYDRPGGIGSTTRVQSDGMLDPLRIVVTNPDTARNMFRVHLAPGRTRSITFHGILLAQGSWSGMDAGDVRANLRVVGHRRGDPPATIITYAPTMAAGTNEDPLANGVLAPGSIARDIVFRLDAVADAVEQDLDWVAIRIARSGAATSGAPLELRLSGVSCFSDLPADGSPEPLGEHVFDAPWRVLPWVIRDVPYVLALGMDWVSMYEVTQDRGLVRRQGDLPDTRAVWHFTERQLRELTWAIYGGNLLLCHHDFPHPLEVRLPRRNVPFSLRPLALVNLAELSSDELGRIAPSIEDETGAITFVAPGETRQAQRPSDVRITTTATGPRVTWPSTNADSYRVYWDTKAVYDAAVMGGGTWTPGNQFDVPGSTLEHILSVALDGTEYAAAVSSLVGGNESARSAVAFGRSLFPTPAAPLTVTLSSSATVDALLMVAFAAIPDATSYELQFRGFDAEGNPGGWSVSASLAAAADWTSAVTSGEVYQVRVRTLRDNSIGPSGWTESNRVTAANRRPGPVVFTLAQHGSMAGQVDLQWSEASPPAQFYQLEVRARVAQGITPRPWITITPSIAHPTRAYTYTNQPDAFYQFRIRGLRDFATAGPWSAVLTTSAAPVQAPQNLQTDGWGPTQSTASQSASTITFRWTAVPNAASYAIEIYSEANLGGSLARSRTSTTNTYTDRRQWFPGQSRPRYRSARVRAVFGDSSTGAWSATLNFGG